MDVPSYSSNPFVPIDPVFIFDGGPIPGHRNNNNHNRRAGRRNNNKSPLPQVPPPPQSSLFD
jgi:hypothetical protein